MAHDKQIIREYLINRAIGCVAEGGFVAATTRDITFSSCAPDGVGMSQEYIYRLFGNKQKLMDAAFAATGDKLVRVLEMGRLDDIDALCDAFVEVWRWLCSNPEHCLFYAQYYYSPYFANDAKVEHRGRFEKFATAIAPLFADESPLELIWGCSLSAVLHMAYCAKLEPDKANQTYVRRMVEGIFSPYIKTA